MAAQSAPSVPNAELVFEPLDDIGLIEVAQIDMGERLRPVDPVHVEVLGRAILREGQATPIVVCRLPGRNEWTLVAGAHRVEAARKFGIEQLRAEIIGPDKIGRRQREVSENLWRKGLDPVDRANFIAELVRLSKLRAGIDPNASAQKVAANARWQKDLANQSDDACDTMSHVYGWTEEVAETIGLSRRTLSRDLILHTRIAPTLIAELRAGRHPVASNASQLRALAKLEPVEQRRVVDLLLHRDEPAKSVAEACSRAKGKAQTASPDEKRLRVFLDSFGRMGLMEKKGALHHLSARLPAGFTLSDPDSPHTALRTRMIDAIGSLDTAFTVLVQLVDGEPVDDEHLQGALAKVQHSLMGLNDLKGSLS